MVNWIKNIFRRKTILDKLDIVLVDKIGCGWYNLHSSAGVIYEFHFDEDNSIYIYLNSISVFDTEDINDSLNLYLAVCKLPRIHT